MTLYLSKANLTRGTGQVASIANMLRSDRDDGGHALVWSMFSDHNRNARPFIYREMGEGAYLILSDVPPKDDIGLWQISTKPYAPVLKEGQQYRFVLRVNPAATFKDNKHPKARGVRTDVIMRAKHDLSREEKEAFMKSGQAEKILSEWLSKRLGENGAALEKSVHLLGWNTPRRQFSSQGNLCRVGIAEMEGVLTITGEAKFVAMQRHGLGKGKGFGLGLILIRPFGKNVE